MGMIVRDVGFTLDVQNVWFLDWPSWDICIIWWRVIKTKDLKIWWSCTICYATFVKFASSGVLFVHAFAEIDRDTIDFNMLLSLNLQIKLKKKFVVPLNSALPKFELLHCHSETNGPYLGPTPVGVWWDKHWKSKCSPWIKRAVQRNQIRRRSIWLSSTACLWFLSGVWAHLSGNVNTKCSCPAKLLDSSGPLKKIKLYVPLRNRVPLVWGEWHSQISRPGWF